MAPQARRMAFDGHMSDGAQYGRTVIFLRAPQHHSSIASSSDHTLLTMPHHRRRERDACRRTEVL
eukprot:scaffold20444_cov71-Phaeocystis_antarctica.AAC.6